MSNRFYIPNLKITSSNFEITDKKTIHQINRVLRLKKDEEIIVFSQFEELLLKIDEISSNSIQTTIMNKRIKKTGVKKNVILYQSLLKKDNFEWILQKTTELGIQKIVPIITDNTIIREISKNKSERYNKIIIEATEQCGGIKPPVLADVLKYEDAINVISTEKGIKIIPWEGEQTSHIANIINNKEETYHIIIGPEGGFTSNEIKIAQEKKITPVSLGTRILRAETAAIASISLILLNAE